ncbi:uncharacterized protein LOC132601842 [Lycium barbarum]|uniref:uncharacterized protein LOC132601842 n=1 Tax=Lycium barbarum TaxID=112863 RepID=UPI00293EFD78|nr:uncharacterized protein LOC132601842 [Lycium barbarum]
MGLNDTSMSKLGAILMLKPFSSVGTVYSILLSDEKQRQVSTSSQFPSTSASFSVGVSRQDIPPRVPYEQNKSSLLCKYCKKPGHTIDKCYKLLGYPSNFKFIKSAPTRKKVAHVELDTNVTSDPGAQSSGSGSEIGSISNEQLSPIPGLTKDQHSQLIQLLQQHHPYASSGPNLVASVNFVERNMWDAKNALRRRSCTAKCDREFLVRLRGLRHNMRLSKRALRRRKPRSMLCQFDCFALFTKTNCFIQGPSMRKPLVLGKLDKGLYKLLQSPAFVSSPSISVDSSVSGFFNSVPIVCTSASNSIVLVSSCIPDSVVSSIVPDGSHISSNVSTISTDKGYLDSPLGFQKQCFTLLKAFIAMVETQFHSIVQAVRSDNALELGSSNLGIQCFADKGIIHQTSCPHTPQHNGVVERKHMHLLETARALLFQFSLPIRFWVFHGHPPTYDHLRDFGYLCYSTVPKPHRDKFKPHVVPYVFIGYPFAKKGYKLYNLVSKSCFISRDVHFHEHLFPFSSSGTPSPAPSTSLLSCLFDDTVPTNSSSTVFPPNTNNDSPLDSSPPPISPSTVSSPPLFSHSTLSPSLFPPVPSPAALSSPSLVPRKSARGHRPPSYLDDFICSFPPSISKSVSFVSTLGQPTAFEPHSYSQASTLFEWQDAMRAEFEALEANGTWDVVPFPLGKKPIGCK